MSGDLKDPIRSIPKGTLIATVITFFSYLILAITFASTTLRVSEDGKSGMKNEFFLLQVFFLIFSFSFSNIFFFSRLFLLMNGLF